MKIRWIAGLILAIACLLTAAIAVFADSGPIAAGSSGIYAVDQVPPQEILDPFEDDDTPRLAHRVLAGEGTFHLFGKPGDEDWIAFEATAGHRYVIVTRQLLGDTDTQLALFADENGRRRLAFNDDFGSSRSSRITWQAPETGTYFVRVTEAAQRWGRDVGYEIAISDVTGAGNAIPAKRSHRAAH